MQGYSRLYPCTWWTKWLMWKVSMTVVCPVPERTERPTPSLSHSLWHRYRPSPVESCRIRPLRPVKPFSKIRGRSSGGMPIPLSDTYRSTLLSRDSMENSRVGLSVLYFAALTISWSRIKRSHFSSEKTFWSV